MKVLMTKQGKKFLVKDTKKDYHCQYGFIKKEDLKNGLVKTNEPARRFLPVSALSSLLSSCCRMRLQWRLVSWSLRGVQSTQSVC